MSTLSSFGYSQGQAERGDQIPANGANELIRKVENELEKEPKEKVRQKARGRAPSNGNLQKNSIRTARPPFHQLTFDKIR